MSIDRKFPGTIEEAWQEYNKEELNKNLSEAQRANLRMSFYYGVHSAMQLIGTRPQGEEVKQTLDRLTEEFTEQI